MGIFSLLGEEKWMSDPDFYPKVHFGLLVEEEGRKLEEALNPCQKERH